MTESPVPVSIRPLEADTWAKLLELAREELEWGDDQEVGIYYEALGRCRLAPGSITDAEPPADAWQGRLFAADGEVRWVREQPEDPYRAWVTREAATEASMLCVASERRYYLLGEFNNDVKCFVESRYPGFRLEDDWTWDELGGSRDKARAYALIREYSSLKPEEWPEGGAAAEILSRPALVAHRFLEVRVGRDVS